MRRAMDERIHIRRGWTVDEVTASCPEVAGVSATARTEMQALQLLRGRIHEHLLRRALAEHALQAAEELAQRVAAERAAAPLAALRRPRRHPGRGAAPVPPAPVEAAAAGDTEPNPLAPAEPPLPVVRPAPAPSPMRVGPSIDRCIATLVHDVLRGRDLN
jgi:hypothetical protein